MIQKRKLSEQDQEPAESARTQRSAIRTIDHEQIKQWALERGGEPARVLGTGRGEDDPGMIRIDFPGYSGEGTLEPISWEAWFKAFDENELALLVLPDSPDVAGGQKSRFNKIVRRNDEDDND
jgi:hypothetical protein